MDELKLQKLEALLKLVDESITRQEFVESFDLVIGFVKDLKSANDTEFTQIKQTLSDFSDKLSQENASEVSDIKEQVRLTVGGQIEAIQKKLQEVEDGEKGEDGNDGNDGIDGKDGKDGLDGSPDTGDQIVQKINEADALISKDAIEGLADLEKAVKEKTGNTTRIGWGAHPLTIQGLGATIDKGVRFLNFAGAGLTSVVRAPNGVVTVNLAGASGTTVYAETPSGLIDGANKTYTTAHTITNVYNFAINGQFLHPVTDYSVSGTTITMVTALDASLAGLPFTITYS